MPEDNLAGLLEAVKKQAEILGEVPVEASHLSLMVLLTSAIIIAALQLREIKDSLHRGEDKGLKE